MKNCDPKDIAIKSYFLGPQSENEEWLKEKWNLIIENWIEWRKSRYPKDGRAITRDDQENQSFKESLESLNSSVIQILKELELETPKFTPRYIGHMVSEISLPALLGHVCALLHNPNNTSREVSRVTSRLEDEAVADLSRMLGYDTKAKGHFTSGGTVANIEAMWRAWSHLDRNLAISIEMKKRDSNSDFMSLAQMDPQKSLAMVVQNNLNDVISEQGCIRSGPWSWANQFKQVWGFDFQGPVVLVPGNRHFSWEKAVSLLGFGEESLWTIDLDEYGRLDIGDLKIKIEKARQQRRPILLVVSVGGTTEMGEIDPINEVCEELDNLKSCSGMFIWHHIDAAYGGYYTSMLSDPELEEELGAYCTASLKAISHAHSITIDPHKLGYVPYSCGALLTQNSDYYLTRQFHAPYLEQQNDSRWAHTLEGSRSGAGATASWLSNRTLGLHADGHGRLLSKGLEAKNLLIKEIEERLPEVVIHLPHDLNILCVSIVSEGRKLSSNNDVTRKIYEKFCSSPNFSVSKTILHNSKYKRLIERTARDYNVAVDADYCFLIRLVLMNPFIVSKETTAKFVQEFVNELESFIRAEGL